FAKKNGGEFILRIEDTDQTRFVPGAEAYIFKCLEWCGLVPDESPLHGGEYGPYSQSERKPMYKEYAEQLVKNGQAYYAFDTPQELEKMRNDFKTDEHPSPQYDGTTRMKMKNSLSLTADEVAKLKADGVPYVVRIKMPAGETISFTDLIHEEVSFESSLVDDKVLLKADGMPTYHLAVVVDDYLMKITHAFRGEEWLSSAPVHVLLWKYLFGLENMPQWAHLPLILGPNGKLSKRDGAKFGFPVFAMNWTDPKTNELTEGFMEKGFLPQAFINLLAVLGWNDGSEQELFSLDELIEKFSMERVHKAGAKFDFEKAKWFNHEWIKRLPALHYAEEVKAVLTGLGIRAEIDKLLPVMELVKDRCTFLNDFAEHAGYFFKTPAAWDEASVRPKWNEAKAGFFNALAEAFSSLESWSFYTIEETFKHLADSHSIKVGELQMLWRIFLVGQKAGPAVFAIAELLGKDETVNRTLNGRTYFSS
ncbi:MAG: glutamate--tRNA ligase, partial [Pedobacter sp.]